MHEFYAGKTIFLTGTTGFVGKVVLEKLLRTLIDHSVNGIIRFRWVRDEDGKKTLRSIFANSAAGRFLGTEVDHLVDSTAQQIINLAVGDMSKDEAGEIKDQFDVGIKRRESLDVEVQNVINKKKRWLKIICEPVGDDIAITIVDITDGKAKEQKMDVLLDLLDEKNIRDEIK